MKTAHISRLILFLISLIPFTLVINNIINTISVLDRIKILFKMTYIFPTLQWPAKDKQTLFIT